MSEEHEEEQRTKGNDKNGRENYGVGERRGKKELDHIVSEEPL
jgi:hypothetical protein